MNTHTLWTPHEITHVEASEEEPRQGFVGRAAALVINGIECIVLCRSDADLNAVGDALLYPSYLDSSMVYKATLIHSSGIAVVVPAAQPETPPAAPIVPEVPPSPTPVLPEVPVRADGVPVVSYANEKQPVEDDDEL